MPVSGTLEEINQLLEDAPQTVNEDPYGKGWMVKIRMSNPGEVDDMLDARAYGELIA